ncbi:MAG: hypothetical protein EXS17_07395 [Phycisphaerales bacterium]|nr:hypothetical protein [Phycisphaerales bacterium]
MKCRNSFSSTLGVAFAAACTTLIASSVYAQDECASAATVLAGVPIAFNTTTATPSANIPTDALCTGTFLNWLATQKDVWFKFTATEPGVADFTTCLLGSYDTSLALYKTSCSTLVACNGDGAANATCQVYYSEILDISCNTGEVFYVRIGGYDGDVGTGSLTVNFTASSAGCVGATGACNVVHAGLGCDSATCCSGVCTFNPICCEVGWDQSCVDQAIGQCGYYFCAPAAGAPANNCATNATVAPSTDSVQAFSSVNATTDGPIHAGANCQSGSDIFGNDVWFKVSPVANGLMSISTCNACTYDNKLAVYDMGTSPASFDFNTLAAALVGCNDDGASGACMITGTQTPYASAMTASVQLGHTYLIRNGSYTEGETGTGAISIDMPEPCALGSPSSSEAEPCGSDSNGGCNAAGQFETIAIGSVVGGTLWADLGTHDTDFYQFAVAADAQITVSVKAARLVNVFVLAGDISVADCGGINIVAAGTGSCPTVASACLNPGIYYAFVSDSDDAGNPCGSGVFNNYTLEVTSTPATCPITVSGGGATAGVCAAAGPDSMSLNVNPDLVTNGIVACAVGGAAGGSTVNSYARVFPAGTVGGEISCLNFGAYAINVDAAGTYYSDLPLPATIGIYRDLDGGSPRFKTADGGVDGGDLESIITQAIMVTGGVYRATLNFAQPVCVQNDAAYNLVVIVDFPNLYDGEGAVPAMAGYQQRVGGNTLGPVGNTWCRLSCADAAAQFVLTESLGASFTAAWVVQINGTNAANCAAPPCPGDYDGNGFRNGADLATLLSAWGSPAGDITGDGQTNGSDLATLLSGWGVCPN